MLGKPLKFILYKNVMFAEIMQCVNQIGNCLCPHAYIFWILLNYKVNFYKPKDMPIVLVEYLIK